MKRAKIAHLTSAHDPFDDRIFCKECRSLARAGYEVSIVAPCKKDEIVDGVRIKAVSPSRGRLLRMTLIVWQVYREAVRQAADIYHFHDPELILAGILLWAGGKRVIYDIHEDVPRDLLSKEYLPEWTRRPLAWLVERVENLASPRFSTLIAATPTIGDRFRAINAHTIVLNNYALLREFTPAAEMSWSQRPCSVAYVGSIGRERGIGELVQAMSLLPDTLSARLKLAGALKEGSLRNELTRLPGWKKVDAVGVLDRAGVADLLGRVRAGLVLLHRAPNHDRAQPVKLFEYMCAGIPVIVSGFELCREIVEGIGCGLLIDSLNPKAIAEAIEHLLMHPEEAEAMGRRGREAVEQRYNWAIEEEKLLRCYADLSESVCR